MTKYIHLVQRGCYSTNMLCIYYTMHINFSNIYVFDLLIFLALVY